MESKTDNFSLTFAYPVRVLPYLKRGLINQIKDYKYRYPLPNFNSKHKKYNIIDCGANIGEFTLSFIEKYPNSTFHEGEKPWSVAVDVALPCATQNELNEDQANLLVENGCIAVVEGANMPSTPEAITLFTNKKILFAPGKASNAGGVATSGLEMSQNSLRYNWTREEVDTKLHNIMLDIHDQCVTYGKEEDGYIDYVKGASLS